MELIYESINDIECKLSIYYLERERLFKEKKRENSVNPYKLSAIDYSKFVVDCYKKSEIQTKDSDYIKAIDARLSKINEEIASLESIKKKYIENLSKMDGIEYRLYAYILKGICPTKAINMVAEENYLKGIKPATEMGILPYYKNVKKICKL